MTTTQMTCPYCNKDFDVTHDAAFVIVSHFEVTCPPCGGEADVEHECGEECCLEWLTKKPRQKGRGGEFGTTEEMNAATKQETT